MDGTIISVNQIGAKILGYEQDELIGAPITNCYVFPEKREELVNQLLRDGFVVDYRIEFKGKNNKRGYISINGTVYEDETTRKSYFVTTFRDARAHNQTLEINISTDEKIIFCNEMRMTQVLINLVSNASHYSSTDTKIEVNVTFTRDKHQITVKDNGVGISEENIPKLFIPFPDIQSNIQRGTGLGLSICKEIIQLHGGQIWAESEGIGKGSTFSFTIPK